MTMRSVVVALALSVGLFAKVSHAGPMVIEPDDFCEGCIITPEDGTTVSHAYKHWGPGQELQYRPVYAARDRYEGPSPIAPTGSLVMGIDHPLLGTTYTRFTSALTEGFDTIPTSLTLDSFGSAFGNRSINALRIDFADAIDFFSIDMFSASGDSVAAFAFDSAGNQIGLYWGRALPRDQRPACASYSHSCYQYEFSVQRASADIATLIVGSASAAAGIDAIRYNVPEPGTLGMMLGATLLMGFGARRSAVAKG
jgi:hypothetical protein